MSFALTLARLKLWLVVHLSPRFRRRMYLRHRLARKYLTGSGIEIGALHMPLRLPERVTVRYVDYLHVPEQRQLFAELAWLPLAPVAVVDNGEALAAVAGESVDFVVANHVIEHCEDPIHAIASWLRVTRSGGVIFMAVPDKRRTFDRRRPLTTVEHLLRDHAAGPAISRRAHWEEICSHENVPVADIDARIAQRISTREHPHYHVWTAASFAEFLDACRERLQLPFRVETLVPLGEEFIAVLRKAE